MRLSIVIVNWNAGQWLNRCVHSILSDQEEDSLQGVEVVVVDNASSDGSIEYVAQSYPSVCCIRNRENVGFARATNQGIRCSGGPYVLLLNPDTEVLPGTLSRLSGFMESRPDVGAVGAMLLNGDGSLQISAYPEPTLFREAWRLFHLDRLKPLGTYAMTAWPTDRAREVDVLMGACILLRREALEQCGFLDERFFIYSEDQDLCRSLRDLGWKVIWLPPAGVIHYGGQSTKQIKTEMFIRLYKEKVSYFRKHHGEFAASCYKILLLGASVLRQILGPLALFCGKSRRSQLLEVVRSYRLLVRELPGF